MEWINVRSRADVDYLLDRFGGFHDSCLREMHVWTEHWVGEDLAMAAPPHLDTRVRVLFHRQSRDPSAIEILFSQVTRLNLVPSPEDYDSIIFEATLLIRGDNLYWSDHAGWSPDAPDRDRSTWIAAKQLAWREASEWLGNRLRYGPSTGCSEP
jgi:hypothetical protein